MSFFLFQIKKTSVFHGQFVLIGERISAQRGVGAGDALHPLPLRGKVVHEKRIAFRHGLIVHGYRDAFDFILRIWVEEPVEHETQIPGQFEHGLVYILQGIARDVSQTIQVTP